MDYCFNGGCWGAVFAVPQSVVDNYIKLANEAALKVLLFVLRNSGRNLSSEEISAALNLNENQIEEAFLFWENANILSKGKLSESSEVSNKTVKESPIKELHIEVVEKSKKPIKKNSIPSGTAYNLKPTEIAERIKKSEDVRVMFMMAETSFGRPLNHTEQRSFIWMHDYLGMSADVLITIAAYCISIDRANIKYIETLAADYSEKGITTLELVQEEIKVQEEKNSFTGKVMKAFSMARRPTAKQQEFIDNWKTKGYSFELIEYAYEKTVESIDKLNFPYLNKILENWYAQGLITKSKIDSGSAAWKNKIEKESEHSYNLDDYKLLVNNFGDK